MRLATPDDLAELYELVQRTIRTCYACCYSPSIVDAFCRYHSLDSLKQDVTASKVHVLEKDGRIVGTGTLDGCYIGRVYVLPEEQGKGLGTKIMDELEQLAAQVGSVVTLDSSVPGKDVYLHRGYTMSKTEVWDIERYGNFPAAQLTYEVMEKRLR